MPDHTASIADEKAGVSDQSFNSTGREARMPYQTHSTNPKASLPNQKINPHQTRLPHQKTSHSSREARLPH
jgi:hypothetical protein